MNMHLIGETGDKTRSARNDRPSLRRMTAEQLLHLGACLVAYLKTGTCDGETVWMLYGADGSPLAVADTLEMAVETAVERGLGFVTVH
jgi:hypothetical protein